MKDSRICIWCGDECTEESCEGCKIFDYEISESEYELPTGLQII